MNLKIYLSLFIGLIFCSFLIILVYGHYFPNLPEALGIVAISSPFIILLYYMIKEKEREKENLNLLKNRLVRIINHIYNVKNEIGEIPDDNLEKVQFLRKRKRKRHTIITYISNLSDFGPKLLNQLKVEITGIRFESFKLLNKYKFTPSGLKKINKNGEFVDITFTKEKRYEILSELNNLIL